MAGDVVAGSISVLLALLIVAPMASNRSNQLSAFFDNVASLSSFPLCLLLGMAVAGTYRANLRIPNQSTFTMLKDFMLGVSLGVLGELGLSNVLYHVADRRRATSILVLAVALTAFALVSLGRVALRHVALVRRPVRTLVVDTGLRKDRISTHIAIQHGFELIGWVVPTGPVPEEAIGKLEDLEQIVIDNRVDRVVIGSTGLIGTETASIYRSVLPWAKVSLVPRGFELVSWRSQLTDLSGLPLLEVAPSLMTRWDRALKRLIDIVGSVLALIVTSPLWIVLPILIKATSEGPVFFRQPRVGRRGKEFSIVKFRTMTVHPVPLFDEEEEAEEEGDQPLHRTRGKARLANRSTSVGAVLRRYGLDEIPQFLNVLVGDMSIVGPRPFIPEESDRFEGWTSRRFEVRPGITGLWQVSGRNELSEDELRQLDYLYVASWSMFWDLRIMLETPKVMVRGLGAY